MSLKIMRVTANREEELRKFFRGLDDSTPVFMLRRNLKDAYNSLEQAKKTGAWRRNRIKLEDRMSNRNVVKDDMYYAYESSMTKYFEKLERLMRDEGVVWDEIDYDEASMSKTIVAKKQGCYITNCNYL